MDSQMAQKTFELANEIVTVPSIESVYHYDAKKQQEILQKKPWAKE